MANLAFQVTGNAFQGISQFAFQGSIDVPASSPVGGGYIRHHPDYFKKSRKRIREEREAVGISTEVLDLIDGVAKRQALAVQSDSQKQFEELERALQIADVEWQGRYLEVLNDLRERYIAEEISRLLAKKLQGEEDEMRLMALAALI